MVTSPRVVIAVPWRADSSGGCARYVCSSTAAQTASDAHVEKYPLHIRWSLRDKADLRHVAFHAAKLTATRRTVFEPWRVREMQKDLRCCHLARKGC